MTAPDTDTLAGLLTECTPGPWFTGSHDPERGIWIGGRDRHDGGAVLPYLYFGHTINWPKNYEANARLIALAPTLAAETIALRAQAAKIERLEAALRDAEETLRLVEHPAFPDPVHHKAVKALGSRIGFGALMSTASAAWRETLEADGYPPGGEYVAGPCFVTVASCLAKIRAALEDEK